MAYSHARHLSLPPRCVALATTAPQCAEQHLAVTTVQTARILAFDRGVVLRQSRLPGSPLKSSRAVQCRAAAPQSTKLDSSMIWGDIMMLTATELASERLPKQVTGVLSLTLLAAWIGVSSHMA